MIKHPLSFIDGTKHTIKDAFSWILHYYDPNKNIEQISFILDSTCSEMVMWKEEDKKKFIVTTNDFNPNIKADHHMSCHNLGVILPENHYDIIIYDPPYVDLKNRNDPDYENIFNYRGMKTPDNLMKLSILSSNTFNFLLRKNGILICKITNFHYEEKLRGTYDYVNWFKNHFYLYDEVIYRFYKPIPNLNFYKKKVAKTHTYFMIFKKH